MKTDPKTGFVEQSHAGESVAAAFANAWAATRLRRGAGCPRLELVRAAIARRDASREPPGLTALSQDAALLREIEEIVR